MVEALDPGQEAGSAIKYDDIARSIRGDEVGRAPYEVLWSRRGRHVTALIRPNGLQSHYFVKRVGDSRVIGPLSLSGELAAQEILFGTYSESFVARRTPELLHATPDVLFFTGLRDHKSLSRLLHARRLRKGDVTQAAHIAASLHSLPACAGATGAPILTCPVILYDEITPDDVGNTLGLNEAFLRLVGISPELQSCLRRAREMWTPTRTIHGDFQLDNLIRPRDGEELSVVDWELFGVGDPAWDLGAFVGGLYYSQLNEPSKLSSKRVSALVGEFLRSYNHHLPLSKDEADKVFAYAAAWVVMKSQVNIALHIRPTKLDVRAIALAASLAVSPAEARKTEVTLD